MSADVYDCRAGATVCVEDDSDAIAYNLGLHYTMPAGSELRFAYGKVDNKDNGTYDFGIRGSGVAPGEDTELWEIGMIQWF